MYRCKMHVLGPLVEKKYRMYIPKVNIPLPSTQFDPRALAILLHVAGSTLAVLSFCVLCFYIQCGAWYTVCLKLVSL